MEVAPGPLARTYTAPLPSHSRINNSSSSSLSQSQASSNYYRSSDSTQGTSQSSYYSPSATAATQSLSGVIEASDNVINKSGEKGTSLFQICLNLKERLESIPDFQDQLDLELEHDDEGDIDPVTLLWRTFRRGVPLILIYNALDGYDPIPVESINLGGPNRGKAATYKFLQACLNTLNFPAEECFILSDLYGDDTTGFVKVAKVVNRIVNILIQQGVLAEYTVDDDDQPKGKRTQRQHIVAELVQTERTYVQHLEVLQAFKKLIEQKGIIPGDAIHDIFMNLNTLLDFQRRFLIRVEQTNAQRESDQNWGKIFTSFAGAFTVYEPFIANQTQCEMTAMREFDKLKEAGGPAELRQIVESPTHLTSFLLKPFQRLTKYPLLLRELLNKGDLDPPRRQDIEDAIHVTSSILERTNANIDFQERLQAVAELKTMVEDWRGHRVDAFGMLLLYGSFTVQKGETTKSSDSREYKIYLFEKILLCCKEANPNKQKGKIISKSSSTNDRRGKPKLQLKGRIFMQNVTQTIFLSKPGSYTGQIFWRGDDSTEYFIIQFTTEEMMRKWRDQIQEQRRIANEQYSSDGNFIFMREQGVLENPYRQQDEDEYDGQYPQGENEQSYSPSDFANSRNGSSGNLMNNATSRLPGGRLAAGPGAAGLAIRTQPVPGMAPPFGPPAGNSFFSPGGDSPISARTSTSSGMFPFPRQSTPSNARPSEEHNRYTAPAMGRNGTKDSPQGVRNPSNGSIVHPGTLAHTRLRSASSPDVHVPQLRRYASGSSQGSQQGLNGVPDVPPMPTHLAHNSLSVSRSQTNSPINANGAPPRTLTQSPNCKRSMMSGQGPYGQLPGQEGGHYRSESLGGSSILTSNTARTDDLSVPTQLKVKVRVPSEGSTMTLVVGVNISYQSLKDRIDAKLQRHTNLSLSAGNVKLKFLFDDELVSIQTDEDVQTAFETWREQDSDNIMAGSLGEIELWVQI